ncbi:MAG: hypothetical protein ABW221_16550 [Vicinamibacteria bacterium]
MRSLALPLLLAAAQVPPDQLVRPAGSGYGPTKPVELSALAFTPEVYEGDNVEVRGTLKALVYPRYWTIEAGGARALVIPGNGVDAGALTRFTGFEVEMRGVARMLNPYDPQKDKQHYPDLPVRPRGLPGWPEATITVHALFEVDGDAGGRPVGETLAELIRNGDLRPGTSVTVSGVFRGRNLFGDLPKDSQRGADDWVLKDGAFAAWVTGRRPAGKGWSLDPASRGDARWRVEVVGKVEVVGDVAYVRASKVSLAGRADRDETAAPE